jgi:hypothetical protein
MQDVVVKQSIAIYDRSRMELRQLRYVEAVARHRHFTRAAEELHVAQSALSHSRWMAGTPPEQIRDDAPQLSRW